MSARITLVGTNHNDRKGPDRLNKIVHHVRPSIITYEQSPESMITGSHYLHDIYMGMTKRASIFSPKLYDLAIILRNMMRWETYPKAGFYDLMRHELLGSYEGAVIKRYAKQNGISVIPVEGNDERQDFIEFCEIEYDDYFGVGKYCQKNVDNLYYYIDIMDETRADLMSKRDEVMANNIRFLSGNILHVSGFNHIYGLYDNLYMKLKDLKPKTMTLLDADKL